MASVTAAEKSTFFQNVEAAAKKAAWCALATVAGTEARVCMVHPTWEDGVLWVATGINTAKARQVQGFESVDIQFQVSPEDLIHLLVRGGAKVYSGEATKARIWDVIDYDLSQFWPHGPGSHNYCVIKVVPSRVELCEMFGTSNRRV